MSWYSGKTQIFWACSELISGREISQANEIAEVRGWRLGAIIHRLRKHYDWPIEVRYDKRRIAYYRLADGTDISILKMPPSCIPKKKKGVAAPLSQKSDSNNPKTEDSDQ